VTICGLVAAGCWTTEAREHFVAGRDLLGECACGKGSTGYRIIDGWPLNFANLPELLQQALKP
jgi:hypothetical protein